jgi:DNA-directed RNA polymerase specialized sigma24 family protein
MAMAEQIPAELADKGETSNASFAELVRRHQAMVYSIALHFLIDSTAAEELAQDVFLQLHANLGCHCRGRQGRTHLRT